MKDRFGREIDYMRVSVTDRCNLRCVYCMPAEGVPAVDHGDILTFDEIVRLCSIMAELGIRKIKLTGGEPLVRRGLPQLLGKLKQIPGIEEVTLTTNGLLLGGMINELVTAGLDAVNISLDTLDPLRYREVTRGGKLEDALNGLDAALSFEKLKVKINCVLMAGGKEEDWIALARLAKDRPVEVRFIEMMPIGLGRDFSGISGDEVLKLLTGIYGTPRDYSGCLGNGPAVYVQFPGFCARVGFISAVSHQFCETCNRVRLTSEGCLKLCLQYESGTDLRELLRSGADDTKIKEAVKNAVFAKPACHHFTEAVSGRAEDGKMPEAENAGEQIETKGMSRIGG